MSSSTNPQGPTTQPTGTPTKARSGTAVAFMFVSLAFMVVTITLSLFLPSVVSYAICAALYLTKLLAERLLEIKSPLTVALLAAYLGLLFAEWSGVETTGYSGMVLFSWLFLVVGLLLAIGRPFTTFYSHGQGLRSVHIVVSAIWLVTYASALIATVVLIPNPLFLFVPAAFCLAGGAATLWVNFVWCGRTNERKTSTTMGDFTFRQISHADPAFHAFCEKFVRAVHEGSQRRDGAKSWQEIAGAVEHSERQFGSHSIAFVCEHNGAMVGSVRCVLDHPVLPLPTEKDVGTSFDGLRRYGRLMLVGRFTIDEAYRGRTEIMNGLFRCVMDLALERDVSYLISAAFAHVLPLNLKLGFEFMYGRKDARHAIRNPAGLVCYPLVMNFETMATQRTSVDEKFELKAIANAYLAERWFKRALVRRMFRRMRKLGDLGDIAAIQRVLLPQDPARQAA